MWLTPSSAAAQALDVTNKKKREKKNLHMLLFFPANPPEAELMHTCDLRLR